jgi:hypothetical protein
MKTAIAAALLFAASTLAAPVAVVSNMDLGILAVDMLNRNEYRAMQLPSVMSTW